MHYICSELGNWKCVLSYKWDDGLSIGGRVLPGQLVSAMADV